MHPNFTVYAFFVLYGRIYRVNVEMLIFLFFQGQPYKPYEPVWFKQVKDEETGGVIHKYTGKYWECKSAQNWSKCPDIF